MKKLRLFVMLFATVAVGLIGCEKGGNDTEKDTEVGGEIITPGGKSCLLTKIEEEDDDYYESYEYDNQKRVVKVRTFDGTEPDGYYTYTYTGSQIIEKEFNENDTESDEITIYTVSNGVVTGSTSTETSSDNGHTTTYVYTETYEHNSSGYLIKKTTVNRTTSNQPGFTSQESTGTTTYTYTDGNLTKEVETYANGNYTQTYTTTYEYDLNIANTLIVDDNLLISKPNKNVVKKRTETSTSQGAESNTYVSTYAYVLNADKLITKRTTTHSSSGQGSETYASNFVYTCN